MKKNQNIEAQREKDDRDERCTLKQWIIKYIIKCIDETENARQKGADVKYKVGYSPLSFQLYLDREKRIAVNIDYIEEVFREVNEVIKDEPVEENRKFILEKLTF
jgi:hypothetical protein